MSLHHQLLPGDWPQITAAFTQLRLYRRGLTSDLSHVIAASLIIGYPLSRSPAALSGLETRLRELLEELEKELE